MSIETELQAQVDAQLMEQGAFSPLEMLFNSGRLIYGDYEAWRRREIESLDDVLMGDPRRIADELERAAAYARRIGLVEQSQELTAWGETAGPSAGAGAPHSNARGQAAMPGRSLRASGDPSLQRLLGNRYLPAQSAPQMDLFFDNPVVALTNGICRALSGRDLADSRRLLDRLYIQQPNHPDLAAFDQLVGAHVALAEPVEDSAGRLEFLTVLTPTARRLLGPGSRDYLAPLWRQLAEALAGCRFAPSTPDLHRSFALVQAQDWAEVSDSVLAEPQWWLHAPLCLRLAESAFRRRRRAEAITAWCHLCWIAPEEASQAAARQHELSELWRAYLDDEAAAVDEGISGPALSAREFPAWLLLREPGLARLLSPELPRGNSPAAERCYTCIHRWIHARQGHRTVEELALRKELQQGHPVLFWVLKRSLC